MGKLKDALRKFGTKLTGKPTLDSNSYADIINDIADDYEGGGGSGTTVIANPTLVGTEANLTGLQVGDTKYKVPEGGSGGSSLYYIEVYGDFNNYTYSFTMAVDTLSLETYEDLYQYISNKVGDSSGVTQGIPVVGGYDNRTIIGVGAYDSSILIKDTSGGSEDTYGTENFSISYLGNQ